MTAHHNIMLSHASAARLYKITHQTVIGIDQKELIELDVILLKLEIVVSVERARCSVACVCE
ncbi:hypothetical protein D8674_021143 [Pyrus ussuriensis x Pyrus communis]|uniref:Uncharacterized protein n=1 Tax=Pyrus ussuriensis x Pyrus communis TaxID=2448454 RepID=A0A5N5HI78_9ROSA|nr:hypothetical protein D8674_021143 [Pyrus ussuriensis x Pyrus communis]